MSAHEQHCGREPAPAAVIASAPAAGDAPSDLSVWTSIFHVKVCVSRELDRRLERDHALSLSALQALVQLQEADGSRMRMSDLADAAGLSRSGLTRLCDRLEQGGLLTRDRCCDDARGAFAILTEEGRTQLAAARSTYEQVIADELLVHLAPDERAVIVEALGRVTHGCGCVTS